MSQETQVQIRCRYIKNSGGNIIVRSHKGGQADVKFKDLPEELRKKFQGLQDWAYLTEEEMAQIQNLVPKAVQAVPVMAAEPVVSVPTPAPIENKTVLPQPPQPSQHKVISQDSRKHFENQTLQRNPILGPARVDRKILQLKKVSDLFLSQDIWELQYDLPILNNEWCPNPCWRVRIHPKGTNRKMRSLGWWFPGMWRVGARSSLSCWSILDRDVQRDEFQRLLKHWNDFLPEWRTKGMRIRMRRWHPDERKQCAEDIFEMLNEEVCDLHQSLLTNVWNASDVLKKKIAELDARVGKGYTPAEKKEYDEVEEYRDNQIRQHLRVASEHLDDVISAIKRFDMEEDLESLISAFRKDLVLQAMIFNNEMAAKGRKPASL